MNMIWALLSYINERMWIGAPSNNNNNMKMTNWWTRENYESVEKRRLNGSY